MTRPGPIGVVTCACVLLTLLAADTRSQQRSPSATSSRPNVILIMTDDMGYADLGSYGGKDIKTPILDRLARDGVRLTDAYANGVLCSPTRAALISGRYPQRGAIETALGPEGTRGLAVSGSSLPQLLKSGGYRTGPTVPSRGRPGRRRCEAMIFVNSILRRMRRSDTASGF